MPNFRWNMVREEYLLPLERKPVAEMLYGPKCLTEEIGIRMSALDVKTHWPIWIHLPANNVGYYAISYQVIIVLMVFGRRRLGGLRMLSTRCSLEPVTGLVLSAGPRSHFRTTIMSQRLGSRDLNVYLFADTHELEWMHCCYFFMYWLTVSKFLNALQEPSYEEIAWITVSRCRLTATALGLLCC